MSSSVSYIPFNASTVPLKGSNLIEASAGTGKTYSIAILVLRLILERQLSIREILMVTFTKAAVAELEERIRLFIREAYKASLGEDIGDNTIMELVNGAMENSNPREVQDLLKRAFLFLDETAVLTIHSFCQQTLSGFAFESNQLFGSETLQDPESVIQHEVNKFWRQHITTIPVGLLEKLLLLNFNRLNLIKLVKEHLYGKNYLEYDSAQSYRFCEDDHLERLTAIVQLEKKELTLKQDLLKHIENNRDQYARICAGNKYANQHVLPFLNQPQEFLDEIVSKRSKQYIKNLFPCILKRWDEYADAETARISAMQKLISALNCAAIQDVSEGFTEYKQRNNLVTFNDMIIHLHEAIVGRDNPSLVTSLQKKYKAVFVDEFQDTDRLQYEIFQKAFEKETILFYIGDPKQSIYAFRKADIFTYFKAGSSVDMRYGMNRNYRSSANYIEAMNLFFKPVPDFDTFYFKGEEHAIEYIHVESPPKNSKGHLYRDTVIEVPVTIYQDAKIEEVNRAVAAKLIDLLDNRQIFIGEPGRERRITPGDIGILVRTNAQAHSIKRLLSKFRIPAVTIDNTKVLRSAEAKALLYVLEAMIDLSPSTINRALLTEFTGYTIADILNLDDEQAIARFRQYRATWEEDNIYTALMDFVADYRVRQALLHGNSENGERVITNLFQLIELIHKVQSGKKFSGLELVGWLKRGIEGMELEGDEFEQRVESDEEAVKIVTIHKSKGLEYNIVLAPCMDFGTEIKDPNFASFRHPVTGEYVVAEKAHLTGDQKAWVTQQAEQENRRLLYVALTRAVYACYIFQNTHYGNSTVAKFINALQGADTSLIRFDSSPVIPEGYTWVSSEKWQSAISEKAADFQLLQRNWSRMSYTMLAAKHETTLKNRSNIYADRYDHFVFKQLANGTKTGNLLHYIFENIHFTDNSSWGFILEDAIRRFVPRHREAYLPMLQDLLIQVLHSQIGLGENRFCLADILHENRIHEFEFDFPVPVFNTAALDSLSGEGLKINVKNLHELEGVMNGKIDLLFEYRNKYFILDWKSNFLGDTLPDYSPSMLETAMNENNYHLQYLIYTLAVKKYLESRLPLFDYEKDFGGVIYLFVRGVRKHADTGIFSCKPAKHKIEQLESILSKGLREAAC